MERDLSQSAVLCRSGCGFYGSPATDGLCSKCYKDALKRKQAAPQASSGASSNNYSSSCDTSTNLPGLPPTTICDRTRNISSPSETNATQINSSKSEVNGSPAERKDETNLENENKNSENNVTSSSPSVSSSPATVTEPQKEEKIQKKKKQRCTKCKVSVGVIGFHCRCGGVFCSVHRYANEHDCTFNYKEHGAEEIRKNNPQVVGEKVQKI